MNAPQIEPSYRTPPYDSQSVLIAEMMDTQIYECGDELYFVRRHTGFQILSLLALGLLSVLPAIVLVGSAFRSGSLADRLGGALVSGAILAVLGTLAWLILRWRSRVVNAPPRQARDAVKTDRVGGHLLDRKGRPQAALKDIAPRLLVQHYRGSPVYTLYLDWPGGSRMVLDTGSPGAPQAEQRVRAWLADYAASKAAGPA